MVQEQNGQTEGARREEEERVEKKNQKRGESGRGGQRGKQVTFAANNCQQREPSAAVCAALLVGWLGWRSSRQGGGGWARSDKER